MLTPVGGPELADAIRAAVIDAGYRLVEAPVLAPVEEDQEEPVGAV